jgi:hypothetical protein
MLSNCFSHLKASCKFSGNIINTGLVVSSTCFQQIFPMYVRFRPANSPEFVWFSCKVIIGTILPHVVTLFLTVKVEHRLRLFEKRVLRRIFETEREEVTGGWRKLHNERFHNVFLKLKIVSIAYFRLLRRPEDVDINTKYVLMGIIYRVYVDGLLQINVFINLYPSYIYSTNVAILSPSSYRTDLSISVGTPSNYMYVRVCVCVYVYVCVYICAPLQMSVSQTGTERRISRGLVCFTITGWECFMFMLQTFVYVCRVHLLLH